MNDHRIQTTSRKSRSAFSTNQTGPSAAGPGPSQPPEEQERAEAGHAEEVDELGQLDEGELHPGVLHAEARDQLDSASTMSNGMRFSDASATITNATKATWPSTG